MCIRDRKTAVLAESIVGLRRDLERQCGRVDSFAERLSSMHGEMRSMRLDMRAIAIAIDGNSVRLGHIETRHENLELTQRSD